MIIIAQPAAAGSQFHAAGMIRTYRQNNRSTGTGSTYWWLRRRKYSSTLYLHLVRRASKTHSRIISHSHDPCLPHHDDTSVSAATWYQSLLKIILSIPSVYKKSIICLLTNRAGKGKQHPVNSRIRKTRCTSTNQMVQLLLASLWTFYSSIFGDGHVSSAPSSPECLSPCVMGDASSIMSPKAYGTSSVPIQSVLNWNCDTTLANQICNHNRRYAERSGYFRSTSLVQLLQEQQIFYDSNTGIRLFTVANRSKDEFLEESTKHGWPSFRDADVHWENVRVLPGGETVSMDGTHLGHNLPDEHGNRYCINLVCVAGNPPVDCVEGEDCLDDAE